MGAGGTGKTTTASLLSDEFELSQIPSASRVVYEELSLNEDQVLTLDAVSKWDLQLKIFEKKIWLDDNTASFVADRTLLDHWAYCLMYCAGNMDNKLFEQYETTVRKHMLSSYSMLLYFPWGHWYPATSDGVRSDKYAWQSSIDAIITGYCVRWNLPTITMPQDVDQDYRYGFAKHVVSERLGLNRDDDA
jgi:hypothetical protein